MGFLRQEYWNGLPFPSPDLPDPGFKPMSPALQVDSLLLSLVSQSQQIPPSSQDEHGGRAALQSIARIKAFFFFSLLWISSPSYQWSLKPFTSDLYFCFSQPVFVELLLSKIT